MYNLCYICVIGHIKYLLLNFLFPQRIQWIENIVGGMKIYIILKTV